MIKRDCSKVLDYIHEAKRMCDSYDECKVCPLDKKCLASDYWYSVQTTTPEAIKIIQEWSDNNPEKIKLTKEERTFIECIAYKGTTIYRCDDETLYLQSSWDNDYITCIKPTLFPFIEDGEEISIAALLKYEVRED